MSRDIAPRHRYAVTFRITRVVEAEDENRAIAYAVEDVDNLSASGELDAFVDDVEREDA